MPEELERLTIDELIAKRDELLDRAYTIQGLIRQRTVIRPRERENASEQRILYLVRGGMRNKDIARHLGISVRTIKWHVSNLLRKYNCRKREEL